MKMSIKKRNRKSLADQSLDKSLFLDQIQGFQINQHQGLNQDKMRLQIKIRRMNLEKLHQDQYPE